MAALKYLLLFCWLGLAQAEPMPAAAREPWEVRDAQLQAGLQAVVEQLGLATAVKDGRLALAIMDVTQPKQPAYADLNGDRMYYAASLPKIAILLGAFAKARDLGSMPAPVYETAYRMIRYSNNQAATETLAWVGNAYLLQLLESPELRLYDRQRNGGLWVGRAYANTQPTFMRDPLHDTSHGANVLQIVRFWHLLAQGRLLSQEVSRQMKEMMGNPYFNNKFVLGLRKHPALCIYRKTGTFQDNHGDGALIETVVDGQVTRRFILAGLAHDKAGGEWLQRLADPLYELLLRR